MTDDATTRLANFLDTERIRDIAVELLEMERARRCIHGRLERRSFCRA
jgi:hypothetical protein